MKAKKMISIISVSIAVMGLLAGCGANSKGSQESSAKKQSSTKQESSEKQEISTKQESSTKQENQDTSVKEDSKDTEAVTGAGKTLVVYYSATGNTQAVANVIAGATNGDVLELEPVKSYSDADLDWTKDDSRVSREHENEEERKVELAVDTVDNWDSYDTVFIGYPIWWGIAAWPVDGFIEANDFTGKRVIPFATSSTSGMGESGELLAEMAGTGEWQEGERFRSGVSEEDVQSWVEELGL